MCFTCVSDNLWMQIWCIMNICIICFDDTEVSVLFRLINEPKMIYHHHMSGIVKNSFKTCIKLFHETKHMLCIYFCIASETKKCTLCISNKIYVIVLCIKLYQPVIQSCCIGYISYSFPAEISANFSNCYIIFLRLS